MQTPHRKKIVHFDYSRPGCLLFVYADAEGLQTARAIVQQTPGAKIYLDLGGDRISIAASPLYDRDEIFEYLKVSIRKALMPDISSFEDCIDDLDF
jgi:hypothetical protein